MVMGGACSNQISSGSLSGLCHAPEHSVASEESEEPYASKILQSCKHVLQ